ncbi:hypothetical protein D3C81_2269160 [compost metagenome]
MIYGCYPALAFRIKAPIDSRDVFLHTYLVVLLCELATPSGGFFVPVFPGCPYAAAAFLLRGTG